MLVIKSKKRTPRKPVPNSSLRPWSIVDTAREREAGHVLDLVKPAVDVVARQHVFTTRHGVEEDPHLVEVAFQVAGDPEVQDAIDVVNVGKELVEFRASRRILYSADGIAIAGRRILRLPRGSDLRSGCP